MADAPGRIIVLNGTSSAGKSSIARELQALLPEPYLFTGIDFFTPMLPSVGHLALPWSMRTNENAGGPEMPMRWVFPEDPSEPVPIEFGESGHRLIRGMHAALAALAAAGNNVIFEHVLLYTEWTVHLVSALNGFDVVYVGVHCPAEVLDERERSRGNRTVGQARAQIELVHRAMKYHVEVDTSALSPRDAARLIANSHLGSRPPDLR